MATESLIDWAARLARTGVAAGAAAVLATITPSFSAQAQLALPDQIQVGGIVITSPTYEGSRRYRVIGVPIIAPAGAGDAEGMVQFKGIEDVRLRLIKLQGLEAGPLAGYRFGREADDGPRLRGLGDVSGGLVAGGYVGYRLGGLFPFVSYHHQVTGDGTGGLVRFGVEAFTRLAPSLALTTTVGATWASNAYNDAYFGVSTAQALRSGLRTYDPGAGIKDVFVGTSADLRLDDRWTLKVLARYSHLTGDVKPSPVVETEHQLFGGLGLTYRFSLK